MLVEFVRRDDRGAFGGSVRGVVRFELRMVAPILSKFKRHIGER